MRIGKIAVALCVLMTAACSSVKTTVPIGTTVGLGQDQALFGTWKGYFADDAEKKDKVESFVHFLRSGDSETVVVWVSAPAKIDSNGESREFKITTAKLGRNHYFNVVEHHDGMEDEDTSSEYTPVLYRMSGGDHLMLYRMDLNRTVAAIKDGAIPGSFSTSVRKDDKGKVQSSYDYATINADAETLDAFMAKPEAADLFNPYMILKKIE